MKKPSVLYITSRMSSPPLSGGQLREYNMIKRLSRDFSIHLWVCTRFLEVDATGVAEMGRYCDSVRLYEADPPADRPEPIPQRMWQQRSHRMRQDVAEMLDSGAVDLVHVEGYYMMQYLPVPDPPAGSDARGAPLPAVMLVEENIEYLIDRQWDALAGGLDTWRATERLEREQWHRADLCGVVSQDDYDHMREVAPDIRPVYVPHGCDHLDLLSPEADRRTAAPPGEELSVVFVGDYTYPPTHDAAVHLLTEIWPRVADRYSAARLSFVGRGPSDEIRRLAAGRTRVDVTGFVDSIRDTLDAADLFVCPLRVGGGVKLKMLEAVTRGVPVVTSPVGAQGFPGGITAQMAVHDEPEAFAGAVVALLEDATSRDRRSRAQRAAAAELTTWEETARDLGDAWRSLAGRPSRLIPADRPPQTQGSGI